MAMNRKERLRQASQQRRAGEIPPIAPGSPLARNLEAGAELRQAGRLAEAAEKIENALALHRDHPRCLLELANLQRSQDQPAKAAMTLRKALRAAPRNAQLAANLGATLRDMGELDEALGAFRKAVAWQPSFPRALIELGVTYQALGEPREALAALRRSLALDGRQPNALGNAGLVELELGDPAAALADGEKCQKIDPRNTVAFAVRSFALRELGRTGEAAALVNLERLVLPLALEDFEGYGSVAEFNGDLVAAVTTHPSLARQPNRRTTRMGRQTGELGYAQDGPIAVLRDALDRAVRRYQQTLRGGESHPFLKCAPKTWRLSMWGTILGKGGHQEAHIHPQAWLSGAYYAQLPDSMKAGDGTQHGWIEFGRPPDYFDLKSEPALRLIQPQEGTVALFPSYVYHRTVPTITDATRISVAVDVIPLGG